MSPLVMVLGGVLGFGSFAAAYFWASRRWPVGPRRTMRYRWTLNGIPLTEWAELSAPLGTSSWAFRAPSYDQYASPVFLRETDCLTVEVDLG